MLRVSSKKSILEWMVKTGKKDFVEVRKTINEYYKNPKKIMKQLGTVTSLEKALPIVKEEKTKEKKEKKALKVGISDIFGYKVVSEK